jgi:type IV secretion system protein VirB6
MSACAALSAQASNGVAPALRAVDCIANEMTVAAFGRIFGVNGALTPALTVLLTLYIAFFAITLLTGRSRIGISALTPRMIMLGLVLTFSTSWIAYQSVVWTLATGAPDQIATILTGTKGSATTVFADRIDMVFAAIAEVASAQNGQTASAAASSSFTPTNLVWIAAILLLLSTVGVLVTARIALAVLLALGPIFVVLALFDGTRGLTAGWLRALVLAAITPLFVVLGGGIVMELLIPVVSALRSLEGGVDGRSAMALFLIAAVYLSLMVMAMRTGATLVGGWTVFGLARGNANENDTPASPAPAMEQGRDTSSQTILVEPAETSAPQVNALKYLPAPAPHAEAGAPALYLKEPTAGQAQRTTIVTASTAPNAHNHHLPFDQRLRGIGSQFRAVSQGSKLKDVKL